MWSSRFTVSGKGYFPTDMLRYDRCSPLSESDAADLFIERSDPDFRDTRNINLVRYTATKHAALPTTARWASFGWDVTKTEEPQKVG